MDDQIKQELREHLEGKLNYHKHGYEKYKGKPKATNASGETLVSRYKRNWLRYKSALKEFNEIFN